MEGLGCGGQRVKSGKILSAVQIRRYHEDGYLLIKHSEAWRIKNEICRGLKPVAVNVLKKSALWKSGGAAVVKKGFREIFDWVISHEKGNEVSRRFYELFPATSEIIRLVADPFLNKVGRQLGISHPIPSTLPIMRIDRPGEERYLTPPHQDIWYSMLSMNSLTFWMPLLPMTEKMGYLAAAPKTHRLGVLPIKPWTAENPFAVARRFEDDQYATVPVGDDEILVFYQLLVHRSASNNSDKARFTLQVRYNDLETLETMTTSFTPKHSVFTDAAQKKLAAAGGN